MTKKLATLVAMLACCVFGALAQRVATTPVTDVQTGVYMLRMKSDRIPGTDGAWVYYKDSHAWGESDNTALKVVTENPLSEDHYNYLWRVVRKDDGKITIQSFTANTYWAKASGGQSKTLGSVSEDDKKWVPNDFPMNGTENAFALVSDGSGFKLKTTSAHKYYTGKFGKYTEHNDEVEVYVVDNVNLSNSDKANAAHNIGYQQTSTTRSDITFEFYEVTQFPEKVSFTYNYLYDGVSKKTEKFDTYTYKPYPAVTVPDFIKANAPEGEIKPEDNGATFTIECTSALPFEVTTDLNNPHLYYFESNISTAKRQVMSYSNNTYMNSWNTMLQHGIADDRAINDIRHDLWCVTGNPFDGFKFYNTSSKRYLAYATGPSGKNYLSLQSDGTWGNAFEFDIRDNSSKWNTEEITDGKTNGFAITKHKANLNLDASKEFVNQIAYTDGYVLSYGAADNTGTFLLEEPTYVLPLHDSEADNAAFATTCAPFNFAIVGDDVKAYAGKLSADGKELDMKEIEGNVPANQGVILKAAMGVSEVTVKVVNTADAIDNDLKGTNDEMTDLSQVYVFGRDNVTRHVGFFNAAGNAALPANRAYLDKPAQEAVNAVAMNFGNGMVTNINTAISAHGADNAPIYDLSGRRVQRTVKGSLYIKGGRKFMAQ